MAPEADGNSKVEEYKEAFQWLSMVVSAGSGADLWGGVALNKKFEVWNTVVIGWGLPNKMNGPRSRREFESRRK